MVPPRNTHRRQEEEVTCLVYASNGGRKSRNDCHRHCTELEGERSQHTRYGTSSDKKPPPEISWITMDTGQQYATRYQCSCVTLETVLRGVGVKVMMMMVLEVVVLV